MNILLIFVLLFLFTLNAKVKGQQNTAPNSTASSTSNSLTTSLNNSYNVIDTTGVMSASSTQTPSFTESRGNGSFENATKNLNNTTTSCSPTATGEENIPSWNLDLKTVLTFLMGVICSTLLFSTVLCFVAICNRCKVKDARTDKESIILESVKQDRDQKVMKPDESQEEQDPLQVQTSVEVSANTSAVCSGTEEEKKILEKEQTEGAGEVNYASINFSLLQKKDEKDLKATKVESDYAEIQIKKVNEGEDVQTTQDGEAQDGSKQDEVDQAVEGEMESQKQEESEEVQV